MVNNGEVYRNRTNRRGKTKTMGERQKMENELAVLKTKENWEGFVKGDVLNFLIAHNLQTITVDDGAGKKGIIKRTSSGDYKVQITSNEVL